MKRSLPGLLLAAALLASLAVVSALRGRAPPVGEPLPEFTAALHGDDGKSFSPRQMRGQVWVLNAWASWCAPCREEHRLLQELARSSAVPLVGLSYRDEPRDAMTWLRQVGNPYRVSASDAEGRAGAALGIRGVPETWVIDAQGVVRHRSTGPISRTTLERSILPLIRELQR